MNASALVVDETGSAALAAWLAPIATVASSRLVVVEVHRAARVVNFGPHLAARVCAVFDSCLLVRAVRDVVDAASARLRSLDAIHLATALRLAPDALVVYDERLAEAARARGLAVVAPA